jgi:aldose 1-epimerase
VSADAAGASDPVRVYTLRSPRGLEAWVIPFGATLVRLLAPDREGRLGDVVLSLAALADYRSPHAYLGSTVGRYANRIGGARFCLDGRVYALAANDGRHHLHGGRVGLSHLDWSAEPFDGPDGQGVCLRRRSAAGEEGYPGTLEVTATYRLGPDDALTVDYRATTDAPTVVSLSNHAYFNLEDGGAGTVLDHVLWLRASRYTPVDSRGLPTGSVDPVRGTPFDFTTPHRIGERIEALVAARGGYDHNFALDAAGSPDEPAARLRAPHSGRVLEVRTSQPGLQLYTANFLGGDLACRGGFRARRWCAVCLETQAFPDAPNRPQFPSARLDPGQVYHHTTVYSLSVEGRSGEET